MNNNRFIFKIPLIFNLSLFATLLLLSQVEAMKYKITRVTNNDYYDGDPKINKQGQIVWMASHEEHYPTVYYEIILWDKGKINSIATNIDIAGSVPHFDINDNGQIVWHQYNEAKTNFQIYLYSDGSTNNISNNNFDNTLPRINNKGQVVWCEDVGPNENVCLYDKGNISLIHNSPMAHVNLQINDKSNIAWLEPIPVYPFYKKIYFYFYGVIINNISNDVDGYFLLNETDQLVFSGPKRHTINRYNNGIVDQIANDQYEKNNIFINDIGQIVWSQQPPGGGVYDDIFFYDNGAIRQINRIWEDNNPTINNYGKIVWQGTNQSNMQYNIFLNENGITTQITNDNIQKMFPKINDNGHIVWAGGDGQNTEIYIATPISDMSAINMLLLDD